MQIYSGIDYDLRHKNFNDDIPFWKTIAHKFGGPILELACGTGRITLPLAQEGFQVTGIDISESMIEQAKRKTNTDRISWIVGDIRDFNLEQTFSLIIFPFNSISHLLTLDDLEHTLSCVKKHLKPNGRFIIDCFNPGLDFLNRPFHQEYPHFHYTNTNGVKIDITESNLYNSATQINNIKLYYRINDQLQTVEELAMRMYFPQELDALLKYNGLKVDDKYGCYQMERFSIQSSKQLIVCSMA